MGKFSFSIPGRKKPPSPQVTDGQQLLKAHKILGSTPINIDNATYLDGASSSTVDVTSLGGVKHLSPDDGFLDDHMRLAVSEGEWDGGSNSPTVYPRSGAMVGSNVQGRLKKSQSSSTIRTRKKVQPTTRQASSLIAPNSHPLRAIPAYDAYDSYDAHVADDSPKTKKKKPPVLDFPHLRPGSRLSGNSSSSQLEVSTPNSLGHPFRSTSALPSFPGSGRHGDKRSTLKRRTKESFWSLISDASGSSSSAGNQREVCSDSGLSTLYNHYEQMSLLQIMKEGRASEENSPRLPPPPPAEQFDNDQEEAEWKEAQAEQDLDWLHKPLRETRRNPALDGKKLSSRAKGRDKRVSTRHSKASKDTNHVERDTQEANFHDKSVLLLSDSEEEAQKQTLTKQTYSANRPPSKMRTSFTRSQEFTRQPLQMRRGSDDDVRRQAHRSASDTAGSAFAVASGAMKKHSPVHARPAYSLRTPSPRESLSSSDSTASGMTCQLGYGAQEQEPHGMTVLPARRPSQAELEVEAARVRAAESVVHVMSHESVPTSPDQLTPPLSPTSVDFYLRSARSSVDASDPPNRIMAVTREEKMLISALRKKNQAMKMEAEAQMMSGRQSRGRDSSSSKASIPQPGSFDFGFPAPPSFHMKPCRHNEAASSAAAAAAARRPSVVSMNDGLSPRSRKSSTEGSEVMSRKNSRGATTVYQDVLVYLDQRKASIGWGEALTREGGLDGASGLGSSHTFWDHEGDGQYGQGEHGILPRTRFHPGRAPTDEARPPSRRLATLSEQDVEDVPRPDSPISPESFPSVPLNRMKQSNNRARLSAVGWTSPTHEPHEPHWGDDD